MKGDVIKKAISLITVEPVLFFYMLIILMESNAIQELIYVKACLQLLKPVNVSDCSYSHKENLTSIVEEATYWSRYNAAFLFSFTLLSSFYVASWSDRLGRKFPMIIPPVGTVLATSINCVLSVFLDSHVAYFFISSAVSGLTFGSVGVIACTFGFISDITSEDSRTKRIVILEAMIFFGGTLGIYIGGRFLSEEDFENKFNCFVRLFIFEICVALFIVGYILICVPDHSERLQSFNCLELFKLDHVKNSLKTVIRRRDSGKRKSILLLFLTLCFIYLGTIVQVILAFYYVKNLHWSFTKYSYFNSMQYAVEGVALLLGLPLLFRFLNVPDHFIVILGLISRMAGFIVFGLSTNDIMVYCCIALHIFSEYPSPAIRSMLSKLVDADEKGRIFAFTTIMQNLCYLLGALIMTSVFKATEAIFPGLCFEIVAVFQVFALIIIVYLYIARKSTITSYERMEHDDGSIEETCSTIESTGSINC